MERPIEVQISILWYDENNEEHFVIYGQNDLEQAYTLIGLMIGEISEGDLES